MTTIASAPSPSATEQRLKLGARFDPNRADHVDKLKTRIIPETLGAGWVLDRIEGEFAVCRLANTVHRFRPDGIDSDVQHIDLKDDTRLSNANEFAVMVSVHYPGFEVISFVPAAKKATIARMAPDVARCREAVASVLGVQRWDVKITVERDHRGEAVQYTVELPKYTPSKHDEQLRQVAHDIVGHEGWEVDTEPITKKCVMRAGPRWSFSSKAISMPAPNRTTVNANSIGFGERLNQGDPDASVAAINFTDWPHALVTGETRSGKGVLVTNLLAMAAAAPEHWEIVICEAVKKGADFVKFKPFVLPGMWGCASFAHAAAVLRKVDTEYERRIKLVQEHGVQKISELPADVRPTRMLVVIDEFATLTDMGKKVTIKEKLLPDEMVLTQQLEEMEWAITAKVKSTVVFLAKAVVAKAASTGIHLIVATQRASAQSLGDNDARTNYGTRVLLGGALDEGTIKMTITSDGKRGLPVYPRQMQREDAEHERQYRGDENPPPNWRKGSGYVAMSGMPPFIAKGWWFDKKRLETDDPWSSIAAANLRRGYGSEISDEQVAEMTRIPINLVKALKRGRFDVSDLVSIDAEDPDDNEPRPPLKKTKERVAEAIAELDDELDLGGEICESCGTRMHPLLGGCACSM